MDKISKDDRANTTGLLLSKSQQLLPACSDTCLLGNGLPIQSWSLRDLQQEDHCLVIRICFWEAEVTHLCNPVD